MNAWLELFCSSRFITVNSHQDHPPHNATRNSTASTYCTSYRWCIASVDLGRYGRRRFGRIGRIASAACSRDCTLTVVHFRMYALYSIDLMGVSDSICSYSIFHVIALPYSAQLLDPFTWYKPSTFFFNWLDCLPTCFPCWRLSLLYHLSGCDHSWSSLGLIFDLFPSFGQIDGRYNAGSLVPSWYAKCSALCQLN